MLALSKDACNIDKGGRGFVFVLINADFIAFAKIFCPGLSEFLKDLVHLMQLFDEFLFPFQRTKIINTSIKS